MEIQGRGGTFIGRSYNQRSGATGRKTSQCLSDHPEPAGKCWSFPAQSDIPEVNRDPAADGQEAFEVLLSVTKKGNKNACCRKNRMPTSISIFRGSDPECRMSYGIYQKAIRQKATRYEEATSIQKDNFCVCWPYISQ